MAALGYMCWVIAEGWIPGWSHGPQPELLSHETACILNAGDVDAHVQITIYYEDREPSEPYAITVPARRTLHQRFNDLDAGRPVPRATNYSSVIQSDVPIVVQHSRLDSRSSHATVLTTMAHPV